MYQLPHLSLATSGKSYVCATRRTNSASEAMECRRLVMERLERLSWFRVLEMEVEAEGKMREDVVLVGGEDCGMLMIEG